MATAHIEITPTGAALGADVSGFDIHEIHAEEVALIREAWLEYQVLRIRGQAFDQDEHMTFARHFGPLELGPVAYFVGEGYIPNYPELTLITNLKKDGKPVGGLGNGELVWHTDMSYIETPPWGSLLHALEVPSSGGETEFLNMYMALDTLPAHLRHAIEGRELKHDQIYDSSGKVRPGQHAPETGDVRQLPGASHPIIRTHPETRRQSLFLGRRHNAYVMGLPVDESEALLDALWAHTAGNRDFVWTQEWQVGDMIVWDNRCVMHRRNAFDDNEIRFMHRTTLQGDKPF
jgi:taurine dioxygenase